MDNDITTTEDPNFGVVLVKDFAQSAAISAVTTAGLMTALYAATKVVAWKDDRETKKLVKKYSTSALFR